MDIRETHQVGDRTREWIVGQATCPMLASQGIALAGWSHAVEGFCFVRPKPAMSQVLVCVAGEGRVLVGGQWQRCGPDMAYLTPSEALHGYHAIAGHPWQVCWVIYHWQAGARPRVGGVEAILRAVDGRSVQRVLEGLYDETVTGAQPAVLGHWLELLNTAVDRIVGPAEGDSRLRRLWEQVEADPALGWSVELLADRARLSEEHLRRLCRRHDGASPMEYVTRLRMRRAASLLSVPGRRVRDVAMAVGYANALAFATAFKRVTGLTPSGYRKQGGAVARG